MVESSVSNVPVVVFLGNTGTGKSAICNYIHKKLLSPQDDQQSPFVEESGTNSH